MKHIQAKLDDKFYKEVKIYGVRNNLTISDMIVNGLKMYVHVLKGNEIVKEQVEKEVARVNGSSN